MMSSTDKVACSIQTEIGMKVAGVKAKRQVQENISTIMVRSTMEALIMVKKKDSGS